MAYGLSMMLLNCIVAGMNHDFSVHQPAFRDGAHEGGFQHEPKNQAAANF